ncbi:Ser/Thr protein phosphatase, putative [Trichomonas vaginalis G3]|uniref:Serine/threonine-protein phosphatase n=1 Tax=Trichomonas vaginalis (strain ATCC PRA-98 / G3) TaxID=412133 RepID=A2DJD2_TRIV3|nr:phosphoprotein phosphatase protein [Trichomonas vaginalis G3]EAY19519.1 Ser/Thr protein phosphatase, putative [Trichomonas vaginalis G3]KAI5519999.1 phosphoprotein phosphatase protein [Trichomonas vaginalis G3]|eukprot:XP_001580505.1 Ser/Thr protein phosphatase [Trichomonas vaginalis G3]
MSSREILAIFDRFQETLEIDVDNVSTRRSTLTMPLLDSSDVKLIFETALDLVKKTGPLAKIQSPCVIIGDLHGHFLELIRFIQKFGLPIEKTFVFLGDIIDRGEFSIETISFIFLLKCIYPNNVVIIRGNHEFHSIFTHNGFFNDILSHPIEHIAFTMLARTLSFLPLAGVIDNKYFCVHGGIGPNVSLESISKIELPAETFDDPIINCLVWSDPDQAISGFKKSPRGQGVLFGEDLLTEFLKENNLQLIIRAHEVQYEGVAVLFGGKVYSVYSASNYCGNVENYGGCLSISTTGDITIDKFPPLQYYRRCFTIFKKKKISQSKTFTNMPTFNKRSSSPTSEFLRNYVQTQQNKDTSYAHIPKPTTVKGADIPCFVLKRSQTNKQVTLKEIRKDDPGTSIKKRKEKLLAKLCIV